MSHGTSVRAAAKFMSVPGEDWRATSGTDFSSKKRECLARPLALPAGDFRASNAVANLRGIFQQNSFCLSLLAHATATLLSVRMRARSFFFTGLRARAASDLCQVHYRYVCTEMDTSRAFV